MAQTMPGLRFCHGACRRAELKLCASPRATLVPAYSFILSVSCSFRWNSLVTPKASPMMPKME